MKITRHIKTATARSAWDLGNETLYELCRQHPLHKRREEIMSKIWLIGRSYAAAIERRRADVYVGKDFYGDRVAPMVSASHIDKWIAHTEKEPSLESVVDTHQKVTQLFNRISGLDKRSLASKYLHFHLPEIFYIYDSRAVKGISLLGEFTGRASRTNGHGDNEYRKFVEKCNALRSFVHKRHKVDLTPRQVDNLLLAVHRSET